MVKVGLTLGREHATNFAVALKAASGVGGTAVGTICTGNNFQAVLGLSAG